MTPLASCFFISGHFIERYFPGMNVICKVQASPSVVFVMGVEMASVPALASLPGLLAPWPPPRLHLAHV